MAVSPIKPINSFIDGFYFVRPFHQKRSKFHQPIPDLPSGLVNEKSGIGPAVLKTARLVINTEWHFINPPVRVIKNFVMQGYFFGKLVNYRYFGTWFNLFRWNGFSNLFYNTLLFIVYTKLIIN